MKERRRGGRERREQQEAKERDERKKQEMVGWRRGTWGRGAGGREGGLMCPSWGKAGQKWLGVELN